MIYKLFAIFVILFLSSTLALSTKVQNQAAFIDFMHKYGKSYNHDEFQGRFQNFKKNLAFIESHNKKKMLLLKLE